MAWVEEALSSIQLGDVLLYDPLGWKHGVYAEWMEL